MFLSHVLNWVIALRISLKLLGLYLLAFFNLPNSLLVSYFILAASSEILSLAGFWCLSKKPKLGLLSYAIISFADSLYLMLTLGLTGLIQSDLYPLGYLATAAVSFYTGLSGAIVSGITGSTLYLFFSLPLTEKLTTTLFLRTTLFLLFSLITGSASELAIRWRNQRDEEREKISQERETSRIKDQFVSLVSHHLRTPMVEIQGFIEWLKDPHLSGEKHKQAIEKLSLSSEELNQSINRLTEIVILQAGELGLKRKNVDLVGLVKEVITKISPEATLKSVAIDLKTFKPQTKVYVDPERFKHAIWNILENAIKVSPSGSHVKVDLTAHGNEITLSISDQGEGIATEKKTSIFRGFQHVKDYYSSGGKGLGIGLYLSNEILKAHGGRIELVSTENHGSTFKLILPWSTATGLLDTL